MTELDIMKKLIEAQEKVIELQEANTKLKEELQEAYNKIQKLSSTLETNLESKSIIDYPKTIEHNEKVGRDKSRVYFEGEYLLKSIAALKIVQKYCQLHPEVTFCELQKAFPKSIQKGSFGVVAKVEDAKTILAPKDPERRFYLKDKDIIHLVDGDVCVCSQFTIDSITLFVEAAKRNGIDCEIKSLLE